MTMKERLDELLAYHLAAGYFTWRVSRGGTARAGTVAGGPDASGHIRIRIDGRLYSAHRLAFLTMTGRWPENDVDHIDGNPADNRWCNLRPATHAENARNQRTRTDNTSGVPGVGWHAASGKWQARIKVNGRFIHLGLFVELEDAVAARRAAELEPFGEFSATASRKILDAPPASC
jgi:hypothetical protein